MALILADLAERNYGWQLPLWFAGSSASLDGARPFELLASQPSRVRAVALLTAP